MRHPPEPSWFPGLVVPDGQGGALASYVNSIPPTYNSASSNVANVVHVDSAGNQNEYTLFNQPYGQISLVVGDNNTAFASDGQNVMGFDWTTGTSAWTWQAQGIAANIVTAANGSSLVLRSTDQNGFDNILRFNSSGQPTQDTWPASVAGNLTVPGLTGINFVASDSFLANPVGTPNNVTISSGQPIDFPPGSPFPETPKDNASPAITVPMNIYQVQGTTVSPNQSISSQFQQANTIWGQKIAGLVLQWSNQATPAASTPVCVPYNNSPTWCTYQKTHLDNFDAPSSCQFTIGWLALTYRFPNAPGGANKGITTLFTNQITNDPQLLLTPNPIENVPLYSFDTGCPLQGLPLGNDIVMSNQAYGSVLGHSVGHVFQLTDLFGSAAVGPTGNLDGNNLMCGGASDPSCPNLTARGTYLTANQIVAAKKGLLLWH